MNAYGISKFRLEVCSFEWSSQPTSVPLVASGAGLWGALGCAPLAEVGECGACSGRPPGLLGRVGVPGVCLQMGPSGSHRRASGVSSERRRSLVGSIRSPSVWAPQASPLASACPPPSRGRARLVLLSARARRRERRPTPAAEPPPSNGARLPAELKHITKRRKRNQQGCP